MCTMERNELIIYSPALIGILLFIAVFTRTSENVISRFWIESGLFVAGIASTLIAVISTVVWFYQKKWKYIGHSIGSLIIFSVCFIISAHRGLIFIYAT